jgi:ergothioneine biosynthesis protein EgtB
MNRPLHLTASAERVRDRLLRVFAETRARTESLAARLSAEDQQIQSMPDASPTKWHRGHTTWFFENFVLVPAGIDVVDSRYGVLFNSYYEAMGPRHARPKRGVLSRPSAAEVAEYRRVVDARTVKLLSEANVDVLQRVLPIVELGIAHEEQHQELLLTDILHAFSENPLRPAFLPASAPASAVAENGVARSAGKARFIPFDGGVHTIGAPGPDGGPDGETFSFDNERPRHKVWVEPFELADRLVTVGDVRAFLREGGYGTPALWLAEGLEFIRANDVASPLYSREVDGEFRVFTLAGERVAGDDEPIAHVSYYEADAIARFLGARLPTEAEWEIAAMREPLPAKGHLLDARLDDRLDDRRLRPVPVTEGSGVRQLFGDVWEWTQSSYEPYPRYQPPSGAIGEYNGKFMVNQRVLRGGSCLTPARHIRASYRNFWHPPTRFQMSGLRLARQVMS